MNKIRVGIVGAGFVSHIHIAAYRENREFFKVVGVCAAHRENAERLARQYGIERVFDNFEQLSSCRDIDVVDVCVPTSVHDDVIFAACENKKHIICEKPLTGYFGEDRPEIDCVGDIDKEHMYRKVLEKLAKIDEAVRSSGVKFMYAENFVYAPAVTKAKRLIAASKAPILELRAEESHSGSHASYSRRWRTAGGGSLLRMGSHPIGAVIHMKHFEGKLFYGKPIRVRSVFAETASLTKLESVKRFGKPSMVTDWYDVEDWSCAVLTFEDGSKAIVISNDVSLGGVKNLLQINTVNGMIYCNMTPNNMMLAYTPNPDTWKDEYIAEKIETKAGWTFPSPDEDWVRGYPQEMRDFAKCLLEGKEPESDFELAKETVKVIYAAYLSAQKGERIELL
ncbi:oxidoreductase [Thermotoga sp. Ku-13t]|uniref:Gfo/Idh/MocA family protein n=1 Tax=Thermotoga sp. Ku-13t TaxID=1755813 RepID=UPI0013EC65DA|nr:Gfo/Idh/MocA family oxidoreductase [Thermotoga sp. Ku-13t]KAF2958863.1 oxidoreductase [Thermotoga sp. Ku-13t]